MPCDVDMDLMSELDVSMPVETDSGMNDSDSSTALDMVDMSLTVDADLLSMDMMIEDMTVDDFPDASVPDDSRFNLGSYIGSYAGLW